MVAKSPIWHSTAGEGPPVILLHGLFGAGSNLGALSRSLADRFTVYSLDLPNHGRSGWVEQAGPADMAVLLGQWMEEQRLASAACVGHSLGGKVMMELALSQPQKVRALVAADIAPVEYPAGGHDSIFAALEAVAAQGVGSRNEAADIMARYLDEPGVIQFLLMSLQRGEDGVFNWRFNLRAMRDNYTAVRGAPLHRAPYAGPVLFVKGGDSSYILPEHRAQVLALFPQAEMKVMPGCGHWLHAEQPEQFNRIVGRFLDHHASAG
ncbi:alpha/beta fold hydrolase [Haliea sp. E17]|uniref:alpha/beta fold hydrolase n=1 Tax=Haliea sp. E17 TaxID=3401576 RepID=UPI003AADC4A6